MKKFGLVAVSLLLLVVGIVTQKIENVNLWPYPKSFLPSTAPAACFSPSVNFVFTIDSNNKKGEECEGILQRATERVKKTITKVPYSKALNPDSKLTSKDPATPQVNVYQVEVKIKVYNLQSCKTDEMHNMREDYTLKVSQDKSTLKVDIVSEELWGALRALETLSQLPVATQDRVVDSGSAVTWKFCMQAIAEVDDSPAYSWRGLLIDISRHYLPYSTLELILDGMAADKLNVMHLHLVDAQSFPIEFDSFTAENVQPFDNNLKMTYTMSQMRNLVAYAKDRGIRVVPEIDMPGHAYSWSIFGGITANCPRFAGNLNNVPLNPTLDKTFEVIKKLLDEIKTTFPDKYLHIGADELLKKCWLEDSQIVDFIANNPYGVTNTDDLWAYFQQKLDTQNFKGGNKVPIAWEEIITSMNSTLYAPDNSTHLIQVWLLPETMAKVLQKGYQVILSAGYYLDRQKPLDYTADRYLYVDTWQDMYVIDPRSYAEGVISPQDINKMVLGGEAAMWAEQVDQTVIFTRLWPRLSGVAERLWSPTFVKDPLAARPRLMHHRCYNLLKRGIRASPLRPDFCPYTFMFSNNEGSSCEGANTAPFITSIVMLSIVVFILVLALVAVAVTSCVRQVKAKTPISGYKDMDLMSTSM